MGIDSIEVECDSSFVVAIRREIPVSSELFSLVGMVRDLLSRFRRWKLNHRWREANRCTDVLAGLAYSDRVSSLVRHLSPPAAVDLVLLEDLAGVGFERVVRM